MTRTKMLCTSGIIMSSFESLTIHLCYFLSLNLCAGFKIKLLIWFHRH